MVGNKQRGNESMSQVANNRANHSTGDAGSVLGSSKITPMRHTILTLSISNWKVWETRIKNTSDDPMNLKSKLMSTDIMEGTALALGSPSVFPGLCDDSMTILAMYNTRAQKLPKAYCQKIKSALIAHIR